MSNSITGALANRFATSSDAATLRSLVTALYADIMPSSQTRPFITMEESSTERFGQSRGVPGPLIRNITVTFWVVGTSRSAVEAIQDAIETTYLDDLCPNPISYTWDSLQYMATIFADRGGTFDKQGWTGFVAVTVQVSKN